MKRLITTLLLSILSVLCVFAFAACGGDDGEKEQDAGNGEDKTTVTEAEWKTALTYFKVDSEEGVPVESDYPRISFSCTVTNTYTDDGEEETYEYTVSIDFDKKAVALEFGEEGGYYAWKDDTTCYSIGDGWQVDSETGNTREYYIKETISEEELLEGLDANIFSYASGIYIGELELIDNYSKFTYSEETEAYTGTFDNEEEGWAYEISVKFKGGKLAEIKMDIISEEYGTETFTYEYTYGTTVTIPEYFLNLELGETEKPKAD